MPIDAEIPLQVKTQPLVDPLQSIGHLMQMRGQMAELQLHQAQALEQRQLAQQNQMKIEQEQRDVSDQNALQEAMRDPDTAAKIGAGDLSALNGRIQPKNQAAFLEAISKAQKEHATLSDEQLKQFQAHSEVVADALNGLKLLPDEASRSAAYPGVVARLKAAGVLQGVDVPEGISGKTDELDALAARNNLFGSLNAKALALKKTQGEIANTTAEAGLRTSEAREHNAEAGIKEAELAAMSSAPGTAEDKVAGIIDPQKYPKEYAAYLSQYKSAVKLEDKTAVLKEAQGEMSKIREATNPEIRAGKVADAVAIAKGTNPIIQGRELTVAGANRAAAEHVTAEGEYEKSIATLNDSVAEATRLHNLIDAAQNGNKAAPAVIPIAQLRGFVNRVNQTELRSVSGAGSLVDKIEGWVQGKTEGQPIPPDILKATDELAALQVQQAEQKHAGAVQAINTARHENLKPVKAADLGYTAPGAGVPTPATQAEFNALPRGAQFKKPNDQTVYTKQ